MHEGISPAPFTAIKRDSGYQQKTASLITDDSWFFLQAEALN
jgi:hypothetical protein